MERVVADFDTTCNMILGVGSGTINDIGKLASKELGVDYISVATAPSMDGFVSNTSSMVMKGIKESVPSTVPLAVIGDLDILVAAPKRLLQAGFGDILAKYTSICEWRISNLVNGEYYCEQIASLMRLAVQNCVSHAEQLVQGDHEAVKILMDSLILSGMAMAFAGITRLPLASSTTFHVWDMRYLEFHTPKDYHGIQYGMGTVPLWKYTTGSEITPNVIAQIRPRLRFGQLASVNREYLGKSGDRLVELEKKEASTIKKHIVTSV